VLQQFLLGVHDFGVRLFRQLPDVVPRFADAQIECPTSCWRPRAVSEFRVGFDSCFIICLSFNDDLRLGINESEKDAAVGRPLGNVDFKGFVVHRDHRTSQGLRILMTGY
jgi:hypothetical protein